MTKIRKIIAFPVSRDSAKEDLHDLLQRHVLDRHIPTVSVCDNEFCLSKCIQRPSNELEVALIKIDDRAVRNQPPYVESFRIPKNPILTGLAIVCLRD